MSALNNAGNLNIAQSPELHKGGLMRPPVALTSRTILPSFMSNSLSVGQSEDVSFDVPVPGGLGANGFAQVTATQAFQAMANIQTSPWDNGRIVLHNVSVGAAPSGTQLIVGTPEFQIVDASGKSYPNGMLQPNYTHKGLAVQVTVPLHTPNGSAPASVTINATGMLLGMATNH